MVSEIAISSKVILGIFYLLMRILKKKRISEVNETQFLKSDSQEEKLTEILNQQAKMEILNLILKIFILSCIQEVRKIRLPIIIMSNRIHYQ